MRYAMGSLVFAVLAGCATPPSPTAGPVRGALMNGYATARVDFGIVVSDIDKATEFYKNALGLVEVEGFDVPADMGGDSGLSDNKSFHVRVFKVVDDENATQVKIMQFKDTSGKLVDNAFIHSSYGIRYLTFYVVRREEGCWSLAGESPAREIVIAPGSSRDSRAGNQTAEALDGKGC